MKKKNLAEDVDDDLAGQVKPAAKSAKPDPKLNALPPSEFIPYYCHYNPHTLLTKNGELLQIIKITATTQGKNYEGVADDETTSRETIRRAILEAIPGDAFSLWLHTIRKRRPVRIQSKFADAFAGYVDEQWQRKNRWRYQYYNEIYITVLHEGQNSALLDKEGWQRTVLPHRNRDYRRAYLDAACQTLTDTMEGMLASIREYFDAQILSLTEQIPSGASEAAVYSEPMEFLGTLVNLRAEPYPLPEADISAVLPGKSITFGFNAVETRNAAGKRRFGALLALKQYRELPLETADRMLQAPMEFIITQSFHFIPHKKALKQYKEQKEYFDMSGDSYAIEASGIADMLQSHTKSPTDFCEHQTSIMVLVDDYRKLDAEVSRVQNAFPEIGLITIREDIKLEEGFWAQLPGNFEFIRRRSPLNTLRAGGFCRLNRFAVGNDTGNHWGDAVSLMPTTVGSPYFFNFHRGDNGHTLVLDCNAFHDYAGVVLLNFLLCQARKFDGRLTIFDLGRSSRLMMGRLGGDFHTFPEVDELPAQTTLRLNPFTLENSPRNHAFLQAWCNSLISPDTKLEDARRELLHQAIEQLYANTAEERHLAGLTALLEPMDADLAAQLRMAQKSPRWAGLFDGAEETLDMRRKLHAFDMTAAVRRPDTVLPVFSYLLHRFITALDGSPSILVLHDAWDMLENAFFAPRLESLLAMLRQNNVMVICTTRHPADCANTHIMKTLMSQCATRLYVPSDVAVDYPSLGISLSDYDAYALWKMQRQKGDFLMWQNGESVGLRADLTGLDDIYAIFANDSKSMMGNLSS